MTYEEVTAKVQRLSTVQRKRRKGYFWTSQRDEWILHLERIVARDAKLSGLHIYFNVVNATPAQREEALRETLHHYNRT